MQPISPAAILIVFDSVLIGVAVQFGIQGISGDFSALTALTVIAFFLGALNFYHGKLNLIFDSEYQRYADSRHPLVELADFVLHVLTLGSFGFMPFFLSDIQAYLGFHMAMRIFDSLLVAVVIMSVAAAPLGERHKSQIRNTHRDWLAIDLLIVLALSILTGVTAVNSSHGIAVAAACVILGLGVLDIATDYALHHEYYFGVVATTLSIGLESDKGSGG